jgi:hypothetical protein
MEKRANKKIESYITTFKDDIRNKSQQLDLKNDSMNKLLEYIYDYDRLCFTKEDFLKRKRVKNMVPQFERCGAKRANDEQCTRRKRENCEYCGTHSKSTPYGFINDITDPKDNKQKVEVWAQDIKGIIYYIDNNLNVFSSFSVKNFSLEIRMFL